ncbi:uncharacterized protein LOC117326757 [Pecten maximus]|uniref:uncharacterized protein LOC117326757 n=1 Tax=Pecten maximus TaxID=6579 RepID=UPI0014586F19|nr:uncharacterized protein LOC117326757 [Pecten maximus]
MNNNALTKDELSSICSSLIDDVNEMINPHILSLQEEIKEDLQGMYRRLDEATDLIRTDVQEHRQYQQHMEHKMDAMNDKLAQKERPVVNLIDDALLDKVADGIKKIPDGIKKIPDIIKQKFASNQKKKSEVERQNSMEADQDEQIKCKFM